MPDPRRAARVDEPPRRLELTALTRFEDEALEPGGEYESTLFAALSAGFTAERATFLGCGFQRCEFGDAHLRHARLSGCLVEDSSAASLDLGDSSWHDVILAGVRFGALRAPGSTWASVRLRDAKVDFIDLTTAKLDSVVFERCVIGGLDLGDARATHVRFEGCRLDELNVDGARLTAVDLRGAELATVRGVAGLRGAVVGPGQLLDLAPFLAAAAGIVVREA